MSATPPDSGTPDLPILDVAALERTLEKDLDNVIKKAERGLPLTVREREMVAAHLAGLKKAAEPAEFALEPEGPASALEKMTQKQLAAEWGVSLRTIKGWNAEGIAAGDPVPLTRPALFAGWFARVHAPRECPERYCLAAQRILAGEKTKAAAAVDQPPEKPPERIAIEAEAKGMLAMLERCRESEARLGIDYMAAVDSGNEVRASFLFSQWTKMSEQLRSLEKVAPQALEALGIYVKKDEIQRELEQLHRAVLKTFRQQFRMCRPRLRGAKTAEEWNAVVDEIVEEGSVMLIDNDFREPLTLDAA